MLTHKKWLWVAVIVFILWKFVLIHLLWQDRVLPPEPDDALVYSGHIYSVIRCPHIICNTPYISLTRPDGYHYLTYRLLWGVVAKIFQLSSLTTFHISFYIGTLMLVAVLVSLLRTLSPDWRLQAWGLLGLSLYTGAGGYHGFFWVVPSFFSVALFLVLVAIILNPRFSWQSWQLWVTTAAFIFTHPISIYALGILPIFGTFKLLLEPQRDLVAWQKIAAIISCALVLYLPVATYLKHPWRPYTLDKPVAIEQIITSVNSSKSATPATISTSQKTVTGLVNLRNDYLNWLFPHWVGLFIFGWFCLVLFRYKQTNLLSIYFATLVATVIGSVLYPQGSRALVLLWPITFLLYSFGFWYSFTWLKYHQANRWLYTIGTSLITLLLLVFIVANIGYSILLANFINQKDTLKLTPEFATNLSQSIAPGDSVISFDKVVTSMILNTELVTHPQSNASGASHYLVVLLPSPAPTARTPLDQFFAIATTLFRGNSSPVYQAPIFSEAVPHEPTAPKSPPNFKLLQQFDNILVYENTKYGS